MARLSSLFLISMTLIAFVVNKTNGFYITYQNKGSSMNSVAMTLRDLRNTYPSLQRQNSFLYTPFDAFQVFHDSIFDDIIDNNRLNIPTVKGGVSRDGGFMLNVDIIENPKQFELIFDLPGFTKKDIAITLDDDNILNVSAHRREQNDENFDGAEDENNNKVQQETAACAHDDVLSTNPTKYHRQERFIGSISRSFVVPEDVDVENVSSTYEDGLLTLILPRKSVQPKVERKRTIAINSLKNEEN